MKKTLLSLLALFLVTAFACVFSALMIPQRASLARIKVESDVSDIPSMIPSPQSSRFDAYFVQENRCDRMVIAANKPQ